jgi:hypothetical protein
VIRTGTRLWLRACWAPVARALVRVLTLSRSCVTHTVCPSDFVPLFAGIMQSLAVNYVNNGSLVTLLMQFAIPSSMIISFVFLRTRYKLSQVGCAPHPLPHRSRVPYPFTLRSPCGPPAPCQRVHFRRSLLLDIPPIPRASPNSTSAPWWLRLGWSSCCCPPSSTPAARSPATPSYGPSSSCSPACPCACPGITLCESKSKSKCTLN